MSAVVTLPSKIKTTLPISDGWESASIDEDDDDEGWIDVHHSSDEEQQKEVVSLKCSSLTIDISKIAMDHII